MYWHQMSFVNQGFLTQHSIKMVSVWLLLGIPVLLWWSSLRPVICSYSYRSGWGKYQAAVWHYATTNILFAQKILFPVMHWSSTETIKQVIRTVWKLHFQTTSNTVFHKAGEDQKDKPSAKFQPSCLREIWGPLWSGKIPVFFRDWPKQNLTNSSCRLTDLHTHSSF